MKILVSRGLKSSDKDFEEVEHTEIESYLKRYKNCYERTQPCYDIDPEGERFQNRAYVDIDGKCAVGTNGPTFADRDDMYRDILKTALTELGFKRTDYALMSSSQLPKYSYRIHFKYLHGSKHAIQKFVIETIYPKLQEAFKIYIPLHLNISKDNKDIDASHLNLDSSVYNPKGRKMRMWNSSKDGEVRPLVIINGASVIDTLLTYIPEESKALPEPEIKEPEVVKKEFKKRNGNERLPALPEEVAILREVLDNVNPAHFDYEPDWFLFGQILYNLGCDYEVFREYSQKSKKFNEESCRTKWNLYRETSASDNTLWWWLKNDNEAKFKELQHKQKNFWKLICVPNHANTASYFYNIKPHAYAYHPSLGWYIALPSNAWEYSKDTPKQILSDITTTITKEIRHYKRQIDSSSEDEEEVSKLIGTNKFELKIGMASFVEGTTKFVSNDYMNHNLPNLIDESRYLFAFKNKVVDLKTMEVRNIRPDDYICINTGYDYPEFVKQEDKDEVNMILWSIWENWEVIDYVMRTIALCLCGMRIHEEFYIWTGSGGNGKGVLADLVKRAFGGEDGYYITIPSTLITKPTESKNATNSKLVDSKGKRIMMASEPSDKEQIQIDEVKRWTGNDAITARRLYKDDITFKLQAGLFIQANTIPKMSKLDGNALTRRLRCIPFPFDFKDDDEVIEGTNMRPKDPQLKVRINEDDRLRDAFILMLLELYPTITESPKMPKMVADKTSEYIDGNNKVKEWLYEYYEKVPITEKKYWIGSRELRQRYLFDTGMPESYCDKTTFKEHLGYCGVEEKRTSSFSYTNAEGVVVEQKCGMYWLGLKRKDEEGNARRRLLEP